MQTLPELLRARIAQLRISQNEAAEQLDVKPTTFSRWINGKDSPHPRRAEDLAEWLDMSMQELLAAIYAEPGVASDARTAAAIDELRREMAELRRAIGLQGPEGDEDA